ncbi:MAG TPA: DUF1566 domain-containing protein, partial [Phycisphaerae bacterium]|nr:DUF1566 domain-containing protein [Phycisphaerae bacterium]
WGGYTDWRLPDTHELATLIQHKASSFVDPEVFPQSGLSFPTLFWSSSSSAANTPLPMAWAVHFLAKSINNYDKTKSFYALCVRAGQFLFRQFEVDLVFGDRLVHDTVTGLTWQGCARGLTGESCEAGIATTSDWRDALSYCEGLTWGGWSDWRLPNAIEIQSIMDYRFFYPPTDTAAFPNTPTYRFFTSTSHPNGYFAVEAYFDGSDIDIYYKTLDHCARCVRGGPWS